MMLRPSKLLLYFLTIVIIMVIIGFIVNKQYSFIYNIVFIYIAYVLIFYCEKKGVIEVTNLVNFLIVLTIILHLVVGQYLNFYETNTYFDKGLHLIGIFSVSLFAYQVLVSLVGRQPSSRLIAFVFVSSIGITIGTFWEILEFTIDAIFNTSSQKGLIDTDLDLIFNVLGANLASLSIVMGRRDI